MGYLNEYIDRGLSANDLEGELLKLIKKYNALTGRYLFVYSSAISKHIPQLALQMDDYYIIYDLLNTSSSKKLDFYVETPGGSGEAAEEIVEFLRNKFDHISFIITGEAKSAGTILALSGNTIQMTQTGSLGPIDAQVSIGRSVVSAYDYISWIDKRRTEAGKRGKLNPFDATMIAQISPGELNGIDNALKFAHDLVKEWLPKYKFSDWNVTENRKKTVTPRMKEKRAKEIAELLTNHTKWRSHGRSLKIADLESIGLKIENIDTQKEQAELVYRIQIVIKLLFSSSSVYKIFATESAKIVAHATPTNGLPNIQPQQAEIVEFNVTCQKCGMVHKLFGMFSPDPTAEKNLIQKGLIRIPKDNKLKCSCTFEIDLKGIRNSIETQVRKKMID